MNENSKRLTHLIRIAVILIFAATLYFFIQCGIADASDTGEEIIINEEEKLTLDRKNYVIDENFSMPADIDVNSPVRIIFSDETHKVISIEKLQDDTSANNHFEYIFGTVDAISPADNDMNYRIYVNGIGYKFTHNSHLDESMAFLDKGASVAIVTYQGHVAICKVLSSNKPISDEDLFFGQVDVTDDSGTEDISSINVGGKEYLFGENTEIVGPVTEPGQWVFGYVTADKISFISVVSSTFPSLSSFSPFFGFVSLVGEPQSNGNYFIAMANEAMEITSESAISGTIQIGDFIVGERYENWIAAATSVELHYDTDNFSVFNQVIDDMIFTTSPEYPYEKKAIAVSVEGHTFNLDDTSEISGDLNIGASVIGVAYKDTVKLLITVMETDATLLPFSGIATSIRSNDSGYSISLGKSSFRTHESTVFEHDSKLAVGSVLAGLTDKNGNIAIVCCFDNQLPDQTEYIHSGIIQSATEYEIQFGDKTYPLTGETIISGKPEIGEEAVLLTEDGFSKALFVLPDDIGDVQHRIVSDLLTGLQNETQTGIQNISIGERKYKITHDSSVHDVLMYDDVVAALVRPDNEISILNVVQKPTDKKQEFNGTIESVRSTENEQILFSVNSNLYSVTPVSAIVGFSDLRRLRTGAKVSGITFANDVLAIQLDRGAGLFGLLNPPWVEYVIVSVFVLLLLFSIFHILKKNRRETFTGVVDIGSKENVLITTSEGEIHNLSVRKDLYLTIIKYRGETITVNTVGKQIISME